MFLKISQNSQENTCARVCFFLRPATLFKKRLWHRCFPVNFVNFPLLALTLRRCFYVDFAKFLRTPFCIEHLWWLLLKTLLQNTYQHLIYDRTVLKFRNLIKCGNAKQFLFVFTFFHWHLFISFIFDTSRKKKKNNSQKQ